MTESSSFKKDLEGIPTIKLVIYGPAEAGKSTLLELYSIIRRIENPKSYSGKMASVKNPFEETALFDQNTFVVDRKETTKSPLLKYMIYAVAGQDRYKKTREIVLKGSEGILLLLDANRAQETRNRQMMKELKEFLKEQDEIPFVVVLNKIDIDETSKFTIEEIRQILEEEGFEKDAPLFEISCLDAKDALLEILKREGKEDFFDKNGNFIKEKRPEPVKELIRPVYELTKRVVEKKVPL